MNRPNQIQSNEIHAVKQQYNELLRFYNIMKKELDDLKEMHANNTYNSEGDNANYDHYKKTIQFLQKKNAELTNALVYKSIHKL